MILHWVMLHNDAIPYCGYCSYWWEHDSVDWFSQPWKYIQWWDAPARVLAIYSTDKRTGKIALAPLYLSIFWSTSKNFADVFKIPTKKTSHRRFKSVYGVWPKKQHCWNLWSVLPSCSVWSQPQLDERGLYVWFALMYTPPDSYRKGRSCRTAEKREEARILKSSRLKVHLHGHSPPPLIYWSRHFHLLKLENVLKYRCWKIVCRFAHICK